jgi:hypothetical protein
LLITALKLRRIGSSIDDLINDINPDTSRHYGRGQNSKSEHFVYDSSDDACISGDEKLNKDIEKIENLLLVKFRLRSLLKNFNEANDISIYQNESSMLKSINANYKEFTKKAKTPSFESINEKYSEGCSDIMKSKIKSEINKNKRKMQDISDMCAVINSSNKIEVDKSTINVLTKYDLIG